MFPLLENRKVWIATGISSLIALIVLVIVFTLVVAFTLLSDKNAEVELTNLKQERIDTKLSFYGVVDRQQVYFEPSRGKPKKVLVKHSRKFVLYKDRMTTTN